MLTNTIAISNPIFGDGVSIWMICYQKPSKGSCLVLESVRLSFRTWLLKPDSGAKSTTTQDIAPDALLVSLNPEITSRRVRWD